MTGNIAKICVTQEKSPVEVCRDSAKMLYFQRITVFGALSGTCVNRVDGWRC